MAANTPTTRPPRSLSVLRGLRRSHVDLLCKLAADHPEQVWFRLGPERVLMVNNADLAWQLLTTHAGQTIKGRGLTRARVLLGDGLLTSEGPRHLKNRRALQPAFHRAQVTNYLQCFETAAANTSASWQDGDSIDLVSEMAALTLDAAGVALFGTDLRQHAPQIGHALGDFLGSFRTSMFPGGPLLLRSPLPTGRRLRKARHILDQMVEELVTTRRKSGALGNTNVLDLLLNGIVELSDQQIRDEVMTLLLAGHETTAMALTWAFAAIDANPGVRALLEAEWAQPRPDTAAEVMRRLPYTTATIAETLRLWPPAWAIGRRAKEQIVLGNITVPPGSICFLSPLSLQRDPRWWTEPLEFRPERWLTREGDGPLQFDPRTPGHPRGAYLPFGAGPRICIGEHFAWVESISMLAEIGRAWKVQIEAPPLRPGRPSVTLRPQSAAQSSAQSAAQSSAQSSAQTQVSATVYRRQPNRTTATLSRSD
jgi:cytochrome P450